MKRGMWYKQCKRNVINTVVTENSPTQRAINFTSCQELWLVESFQDCHREQPDIEGNQLVAFLTHGLETFRHGEQPDIAIRLTGLSKIISKKEPITLVLSSFLVAARLAGIFRHMLNQVSFGAPTLKHPAFFVVLCGREKPPGAPIMTQPAYFLGTFRPRKASRGPDFEATCSFSWYFPVVRSLPGPRL